MKCFAALFNSLWADKQLLFSAISLSFMVFPMYASASDSIFVPRTIYVLASSDRNAGISEVRVVDNQNTLIVNGRIRAVDTRFRGHIDIAVTDSIGKLIREVSVNTYPNNRNKIGAFPTIGFPFKAKIYLGNASRSTELKVKFAPHLSTDSRDTIFNCGSNQAKNRQFLRQQIHRQGKDTL